MGINRFITVFFLTILFTSFLSSQSLVELANKEKERRANLKGKKSIVITNADLKKIRKTPAISNPQVKLVKNKQPIRKETPKQIPVRIRPPSTVKNIDSARPTTLTNLEDKWSKAKEYVALLTLKMNALWQEFYSLDDMTPRDKIQREISETYLKLQKAQQDADKAKKELDSIKK